jgi:hypothetical protein
VLNPVIPLFEERDPVPQEPIPAEQTAQLALIAKLRADVPSESPVMRSDDVNALLDEERKALGKKIEELGEMFSDTSTLVTSFEACLAVVLMPMQEVRSRSVESIDYIEMMLRQQLIAAIGKVVTPDHFAEYLKFHSNKIFKPEYTPKPCCYAIRRTEKHSPQGIVAIERKPDEGDSISEPINTIVSHAIASNEMKVQLSASTEISFGGDRFVHGFLCHRFSQQSAPRLTFSARARQFSSFIVLLGKISGPDSFDPTYGMIVRNKDEFTLPLDLETIPTPKEFKDAIASLSPEQQEFCRAFRGMQLESTQFGVVVIQIQPQLEKLLNLAPNSLGKEIALQEQLMELFIKYQIPSDLLAFEESAEEISERDPRRLEAVRAHVKAMYDMINAEKDRELNETRQEARYNVQDTRLEDTLARVADLQQLSMDLDMDDFMCQNECLVACDDAPIYRSAAQPTRSKARRRSKPSTHDRSHPGAPPEAAPAPAARPKNNSQPVEHRGSEDAAVSGESAGVDYTQIPKQLNSQFEALDADSALRPTIIKPGNVWTHKSQKALLAKASTATVSADQQKTKKEEAFDLLDGLTRAGALSCGEHASLHVVIAATHCFDLNLMDTVVQNNINSIEKVERSMLLIANTIHQASVEQLTTPEHFSRINTAAPELVQALPSRQIPALEE